jgi:zinc-finger binding domain of transposase IS66
VGSRGHPGATLELVADPDRRVRHEPDRCAGCGTDLAGAPEVGLERRQEFDLPAMRIEVVEHQVVARRCRCGVTTCGTAPRGLAAPVQYGPGVTAVILPMICRTRDTPGRRWIPMRSFAARRLQASAERPDDGSSFPAPYLYQYLPTARTSTAPPIRAAGIRAANAIAASLSSASKT